MACSLVEKEDGCQPGYSRNAAGTCVKCASTGIWAQGLGTDYMNVPAGAPQAIPASELPNTPTPSPSPVTQTQTPQSSWADSYKSNRSTIIVVGILTLAAVGVFIYVKFIKK